MHSAGYPVHNRLLPSRERLQTGTMNAASQVRTLRHRGTVTGQGHPAGNWWGQDWSQELAVPRICPLEPWRSHRALGCAFTDQPVTAMYPFSHVRGHAGKAKARPPRRTQQIHVDDNQHNACCAAHSLQSNQRLCLLPKPLLPLVLSPALSRASGSPLGSLHRLCPHPSGLPPASEDPAHSNLLFIDPLEGLSPMVTPTVTSCGGSSPQAPLVSTACCPDPRFGAYCGYDCMFADLLPITSPSEAQQD